MGRLNKIVYECDVCGTEVTVNSEGVGNLSPIYCCGLSLKKKEEKKAAKITPKQHAKKTTARKTAVKPAKKGARKSPPKSSKKR